MINLKNEQHEQQELLQSSYDQELKLGRDIRRAYERSQKELNKGNTKAYNTYYTKFLNLKEELDNLRRENENVSKISYKPIHPGNNFRENLEKVFGE